MKVYEKETLGQNQAWPQCPYAFWCCQNGVLHWFYFYFFLSQRKHMKHLHCLIWITEELHLAEKIVLPVQRFHLCISAKAFEFI